MKKRTLFLIIFVFALFPLFSETADSILKNLEERMIGNKAPKDIVAVMSMEIHRGESVKYRKLKAWTKNNTKGDDWMIMKFISPSDVKNVGLLSLSDKEMYLYLPEFHRIRRIASSNKKDSFMGSDFSYEDLSSSAFSKNYNPSIESEDNDYWILRLERKAGAKKPYSKIILKVNKKNYIPEEMKLYDNSGNLWKIAEQSSKKIGKYEIIYYIKMIDKKKNSFTVLKMEDIKVDSGIGKKTFSKRFLKKRVK